MIETFITQKGEQLEIDIGETFVTGFNQSLIYRGISNGREVVVKFSSYPWGARREWDALRKVHSAGVSSPEPIAFIVAEKPGLVMEYVHGESLGNNPDSSLRYSLGVLVKEMQDGVHLDGREWEGVGKKDFSYYDRKIEQWGKNHIGEEAIDIMRELAIDIGDSFKLVTPVLAHNDLHDNQVIINSSRLYLIDFEFWRESHPVADLAVYLLNIIRNESNEEFFWQLCRGYINSEDGFTDQQKKIVSFLLLFASCEGLDFYMQNRPEAFDIATKQHQGAISFFKREALWKKL